MPSVGMRRSTRVFGTRVLRSGKRLWTEPHEGGKHVRASLGESKFHGLLDNSVHGGGGIDDRHKELCQENKYSSSVDVTAEPTMEECERDGVDRKNKVRKCEIVYKRKRKRPEWKTNTEDGRYAKKYVRKQWRAWFRAFELFGSRGCVWDCASTQEVAVAVNETSYDCYLWITCFLTSFLSYMTRVRIGMRQLSAFMLSKPIFDAYTSRGMLFHQDPITDENPCVCIVTGLASVMPLFSVYIFAIPPFFAHMQTSMYLRYAYMNCLPVRRCENDEEMMTSPDDAEESSSQRDQQDCVSEASVLLSGSDTSHIDLVASDNDTLGGTQSAVTLAKSSLRNSQLRNSRNIQKRRPLRRKRGRPPSSLQSQKAKGALASELLRIRHDGSQFSAASPSQSLRSPDKRRSTTNIKELKSTVAVATQDASVSSCSGNLLITDSEKCYRVEGTTIALESSVSNQWFLTVKKGGTMQCSLTAQNPMRPSNSNRFTHAVMWPVDQSLKLEFTDKLDWLVFKELYKECSDRNMQSPPASVIPVPGVQEVPIPVDHQNLPFVRPEPYITFKDNELTRALMNKTANYDIDSEDEKWLTNLNNELSAGTELWDFITPENFELLIDALEKGVHCNADEHLDEQAAYDTCMHLERKEVIEAVYKYWIRKRKQKRSSLVKVFQLYQPKSSQVIPKFFLRKKRSFKRRAGQGGKQRPLMEAIAAAQRDALQQKDNVHNLQEATAAVDRKGSVATLKRQRAQLLMENADLATYKAMMALKIAEAAQVDDAPDPLFLG